MADITKTQTIPDEHVQRMIDAFGENYQTEILDENGDTISNPQTKAQFASSQYDDFVINSVKQRVLAFERRQAVAQIANDFEIQ